MERDVASEVAFLRVEVVNLTSGLGAIVDSIGNLTRIVSALHEACSKEPPEIGFSPVQKT